MNDGSPPPAPRRRPFARLSALSRALVAGAFAAACTMAPGYVSGVDYSRDDDDSEPPESSATKRDGGSPSPSANPDAGSSSPGTRRDAGPSSTADSGASQACSLKASGLSYDQPDGSTACTVCMQGKCCESTVRCVGNPECLALDRCLSKCNRPGRYDGGALVDGGEFDAGALSPCTYDCLAARRNQREAQRDYASCYVNECVTACR